MKGGTGKLLAALLVGIDDGSPSVRRAMAIALGRVSVLASSKAAGRVLATLNERYADSGSNVDRRLVVAQVCFFITINTIFHNDHMAEFESICSTCTQTFARAVVCRVCRIAVGPF